MLVRSRVHTLPALPLYRAGGAHLQHFPRRTRAYGTFVAATIVVLLLLVSVAWLTFTASADVLGVAPDSLLSDRNTIAVPQKSASTIRGAAPADQARYTTAIFECDGGLRTVRLAAVNDDYCDCLDGSDEPGTAACAGSGGRFYCFQEFRFIPANRVADGVCDCCDGADEHGTKQCSDQCHDARVGLAAAAAQMAKGRARRKEYIAQAHVGGAAVHLRVDLFGPDQAFFPLAGKCFSKQTGEYDFEVCLFESVRQTSREGHMVVLGSAFQWRDAGVRGIFTNGHLCHNGQPRTASVTFVCGLNDIVESVMEPERCSYELTFTTPAACRL